MEDVIENSIYDGETRTYILEYDGSIHVVGDVILPQDSKASKNIKLHATNEFILDNEARISADSGLVFYTHGSPGGAITISAPNVNIAGLITARGGDSRMTPRTGPTHGKGGDGGPIIINATYFTINGSIKSEGGIGYGWWVVGGYPTFRGAGGIITTYYTTITPYDEPTTKAHYSAWGNPYGTITFVHIPIQRIAVTHLVINNFNDIATNSTYNSTTRTYIVNTDDIYVMGDVVLPQDDLTPRNIEFHAINMFVIDREGTISVTAGVRDNVGRDGGAVAITSRIVDIGGSILAEGGRAAGAYGKSGRGGDITITADNIDISGTMTVNGGWSGDGGHSKNSGIVTLTAANVDISGLVTADGGSTHGYGAIAGYSENVTIIATNVTISGLVSADGGRGGGIKGFGGKGGTITITASNTIVSGSITADGGSAETYGTSGLGGTIIITSDSVNISGSIATDGGFGYNAGRGGTLTITTDTAIAVSGLIAASGGEGLYYPYASGGNGGTIKVITGNTIDISGSIVVNGGDAVAFRKCSSGRGGTLTIIANDVDISGSIMVNGGTGEYSNSGGTIGITASDIVIGGTTSANGGSSNQRYGGAGGIIIINASHVDTSHGLVLADGGYGPWGYGKGGTITTYYCTIVPSDEPITQVHYSAYPSGTIIFERICVPYGVEVTIDLACIEVEPGYTANYTLTIANTGTVEDTYDISLKGIDPTWYSLPASITLAADESKTMTLGITPPRVCTTKPEIHNFSVTVVSQGDPGVTSSVSATLEVLSFHEVEVDIEPTSMTIKPGETASYIVPVHNKGNVKDTYDISVISENITGKAIDKKIQPEWISLSQSLVTLDPSESIDVMLEVSVPEDWVGIEDTTYPFTVTATCRAEPEVSDTADASMTVEAIRWSMAKYVNCELEDLGMAVQSLNIEKGIKNSLLSKIDNTLMKKEQALDHIIAGREKQADNMLTTCENILNAFINEVEALSGKKIAEEDANRLIQQAQDIIEDIERTVAMPI